MREIVKSKIMMSFIIMVLGVTYFDSINVKRLDQQTIKETKNLVVVNAND